MKSTYGKLVATAMAFAAMAGVGAEAGASMVQAGSVHTSKKDKVSSLQGSTPEIVRESKRNLFGQRPYAYHRKGFLNQQEKRRKLRSNPSFARSKKCTTKIK